MTSEKKPVFTAKHPTIVDLVKDSGQIKFLTLDGSSLRVQTEIQESERVLVPPPPENIATLETISEANSVIAAYKELFKEPTAFVSKLYDDLRTYLTGLSELPDDRYYDLLAAWALHTHVYEFSPYSPIIVLFAVAERGKTRTGNGLMFVAYRGMTQNSLREANIFRLADSLGPTMFFDVSKFQKVMDRTGSEDMIFGRFEKNARVVRVNHPEWGAFKDTAFYKVYGPTVIGTNQGLGHILGSRSITITMQQSRRKFDDPVTAQETADLRARALAMRAYCMQKPLPSVEKSATGRLGDITKPLVQMMTFARPEKVQLLLELIKKIEDERLDDKSQTQEAEALKALQLCSSQVSNGRVALEAVRTVFNAPRPVALQYSSPSFGRLIKSLGLTQAGKQCRMPDGSKAIPWNEENIALVCATYGIEPAPLSPSETSEPSADHSETTGKQEIPDLTDLNDLMGKGGTMKEHDER